MAKEPSEAEVLLRFMEAVKQAAGCAHQLAHMQQNPSYFQVRDLLEQTRLLVAKIGTGKPKSRQDVLVDLNLMRLKH